MTIIRSLNSVDRGHALTTMRHRFLPIMGAQSPTTRHRSSPPAPMPPRSAPQPPPPTRMSRLRGSDSHSLTNPNATGTRRRPGESTSESSLKSKDWTGRPYPTLGSCPMSSDTQTYALRRHLPLRTADVPSSWSMSLPQANVTPEMTKRPAAAIDVVHVTKYQDPAQPGDCEDCIACDKPRSVHQATADGKENLTTTESITKQPPKQTGWLGTMTSSRGIREGIVGCSAPLLPMHVSRTIDRRQRINGDSAETAESLNVPSAAQDLGPPANEREPDGVHPSIVRKRSIGTGTGRGPNINASRQRSAERIEVACLDIQRLNPSMFLHMFSNSQGALHCSASSEVTNAQTRYVTGA